MRRRHLSFLAVNCLKIELGGLHKHLPGHLCADDFPATIQLARASQLLLIVVLVRAQHEILSLVILLAAFGRLLLMYILIASDGELAVSQLIVIGSIYHIGFLYLELHVAIIYSFYGTG